MLIPARIRQSIFEHTVSSRAKRTNELEDHRAGGESEQECRREGVRDGGREERDKERSEQLGQQIDTSKVSVLVSRKSASMQSRSSIYTGRENLRVEAGENATVSLCNGGDPVTLDCDRNSDLM